jgi:RNA recognition motif-containing protein
LPSYDNKAARSHDPCFKIEISNLPEFIETDQLKKAFQIFGEVKTIKMYEDSAMIGFAKQESAQRAAEEYNHAEFNQQPVQVKVLKQ